MIRQENSVIFIEGSHFYLYGLSSIIRDTKTKAYLKLVNIYYIVLRKNKSP